MKTRSNNKVRTMALAITMLAAISMSSSKAKAEAFLVGFLTVGATVVTVDGLQNIRENPSVETSRETRLTTREFKSENKEIVFAAIDNAAVVVAQGNYDLAGPELHSVISEMEKQIAGFSEMSDEAKIQAVLSLAIVE